ncbi:MAG: phage holin family protein [Patescibacteria group bacterium]|nr:phage holin family protein [Patescibacteria group bacterium]
MKTLIRNVTINAVALFATSLVLSGLTIEGTFTTFLTAGIIFYILSIILNPILKLITLPLNVATLGFFSFLINAPIFYLLTIIIPQVRISDFTFQGLTLAGFIIPRIHFNTFFAYIVVSVVFSAIISGIKWTTEK